MTTATKPRRLGKADILARIESLNPDQPLAINPIAIDHKGSNYANDNIRILGSQAYIDSILAKIGPALLEFDGNGTRLDMAYYETVDRETQRLTGSWAFYARVKERGTKRPGGGRKSKRSTEDFDTPPKNGFMELPEAPQPRSKATKVKPDPAPAPAAEVAPKGKNIIPKGDTWFAIGTANPDEDDGFTWYEPAPMQSPPMDVYETQEEVSAAIDKIKKKDKKSDVQAVFVKSLGKGKYQYT